MEMTPELKMRLDTLLSQRDTYSYNGTFLNDKTFVAVIGPTAVGKSTLTEACLKEFEQRSISAGEGDTITTRERRIGDDPSFYVTASEGVTFESMISQIENSELVNWSMHGTGHLYGSTPAAITHIYTIAPVMPDSLPMLRRAAFAEVIGIYLTIPVDQWKLQLAERMDDPKFSGRMSEAISSLEYAKKHQHELTIITIEHGDEPIRQKATTIVDGLLSKDALKSDPGALELIDEMLDYARSVVDGNA